VGTNLLAKMLSSKVRSELFGLLFGIEARELHLREIERRSGFAVGTIRQETHKLVDLGLLHKRRDGNRTYFKANKEHPIYPEIHNMVLKTVGLVDVLKKGLDTPEVEFAFVFGSAATNNLKPESDIDLLVIGDIGLRKMSKLLKNASNQLNREINPITMTRDQFVERKLRKEHFIVAILNSPKIMIVGTEDELARLAG